MSALKDAYREKAVELVNGGRAQAKLLPFGDVQHLQDGAYVEVTVFVPKAELKGKVMNEREAWLALAEAWDAAVETSDESVVAMHDGHAAHGVCASIGLLPGLPVELRMAMFSKVFLPDGSYRWPLTLEGAAQRAAFCRERAAEL